VVFREQLQRLQWISISIALFAVVLLTAGLGVAPWIALALSTTFGLYGLIKKGLSIGPVVSVTAEVIVLVPIASVILWFAHGDGQGAFGADVKDSVFLVLSGALTATPLILFSFATKRVALSTVGLVQYLNPTLQFFCAVVIFGEPFGLWHGIAFPLIWIALALYSFAALRQEKAASRVDSSVARSSTT
jgi:chloramphenicol-sensitive protein RarD